MAQRYRDEAGNIWEMGPDGRPHFVSGGALQKPGAQFEAPQAATNLQKSQVETQIATDTAAAQEQKAKNEAAKSDIDTKAAQVDLNMKTGTPPGDLTKIGPDYLKTLPPGVGDLTREMLNGNYKGSITTSRNPVVMQAALAAAHATNGNFDAGKYDERLALIKGIASDPNSPLNALNTALAHAGVLYDHAPDVAGGAPFGYHPPSTAVNALENWWNGNSPAVSTYNDIVGKYGPEQAKAYGIGTGGERQGIEEQYSANLPLATKRALLATDAKLYAGKIAAIAHGYDMIGGNNVLDYLSPDAKAALQKIAPDDYSKIVGIGVASGAGSRNGAPPSIGGSGPTPPVPPSLGGVNGPTPPPNGGMQQTVATGDFSTQYDPITSAKMNALIRAPGTTYEQAAALDQALGGHGLFVNGQKLDPQTFAKIQQWAQTHADYQPVVSTKDIPTTAWQRFSASPTGAGLSAAVAGGTAGLSDVAGRALVGPGWDANRQALADLHPDADLIGNIAGSTAGMFGGGKLLGTALRAGAKGGLARDAVALALKNPIKAGALGDAAYGATYGASENPDHPIAGAAIGAGVGGLTGFAAPVVSNAVGGTLRGVQNAAAQRLTAAGIPLTAGEVLGGGFKKAQDALTSVFGPGNMVERRYADGRLAFNQAAFDQAGAPIGAKTFGVGQQGINALNAAKSQAYGNALDPVSLNLNTPDFINGMGTAISAANQIPAGELPQGYAANAINRFVGSRIADDGTMTGPAFQQAYRGLATTANRAAPKVEGYDIGQALGQAKEALSGALQDQNPEAYQGFLNANAANRNLNVLSSAVNAAKNQDGQLFTPAQLGMAATSNGKAFSGNIAAAAGQRPFNQLAIDGQKVMSSKLPDSGTATRALVSGELLTNAGILGTLGGLGGAEGYRQGGTGGMFGGAIAPLGLLTLLGTRGGQKLLIRGLMNRPAIAQQAGQALLDNPALMGQIGTGFTVPQLARQ